MKLRNSPARASEIIEQARLSFEHCNYTRNYADFVDSIPGKAGDMLVRSVESLPGSDINSALIQTHHYCGFAAAGYNRFVLTDSAAAAFVLTETDQATPPLPFDSFMLESSLLEGPVVLTRSTSPSTGEKLGILAQNSDGSGTSSWLSWPDGVWLEGFKPVKSQAGLFSAEQDEESDRALKTTLKLLRGLCSFLASGVEPMIADNDYAVRQTREGKRKGFVAPVFTVGRTIKLSPELRRSALMGRSDPLWKLAHRYTVRGHFRWQPVGKRLAAGEEGPVNARKQWIQPHWKGPEGAEAWQHVYQVAAPAEAATQ